MKNKDSKTPCKDTVISTYMPKGILSSWKFRKKLKAVLEEGGSDRMEDHLFQEFTSRYWKYGKDKGRSDMDIAASDMVMEHRKLIGAESYTELFKRKEEEKRRSE